MRNRICVRTLVAFLAITALFLSSCGKSLVRQSIEIRHGATVEEQVSFARRLVTQERFELLTAQLQERIPSLTDDQLGLIGLRWDVATFKSFTGKGTRNVVLVSVICRQSKGFPHAAVLSEAIAILEPEVNPPELLSPKAPEEATTIEGNSPE